MNDLILIKSASFGNVQCDFYSKGQNILMTRFQIGDSLEYADPQKAIDNLHSKHKERLDKFSVTLEVRGTDGKMYPTCLYTPKGIYEICRWSQQPKADQFYDFVYDTLEALRTGQYNKLHFNQLKLETKQLQIEYDQQSRASLTSLLDSLKEKYTPEQLIALSNSITGVKISRPNQLRVAGHAKKIIFPPRTRLAEFRKLQNLTQEKMGKKLGLSKFQYNRIETGHRYIEGTDVEAFAKSFKMPYDQAMQLLCDS